MLLVSTVPDRHSLSPGSRLLLSCEDREFHCPLAGYWIVPFLSFKPEHLSTHFCVLILQLSKRTPGIHGDRDHLRTRIRPELCYGWDNQLPS